MIKIKSNSKKKSKKKLAYCLLPTAYLSQLLLTAFCLLAFTTEINPTIRYVSPTGNNIPPYLSWEDAANSIQNAIDVSESGDTIYVANGVYEEQVVMINGLSLIGAGTDSCIIDTRALITSISTEAVVVADSCLFTGFNLWVYYNWELGRGINAAVGIGNNVIINNKITKGSRGITPGLNTLVYNNSFENIRLGARLFNSNAIIRKNIIYIDPNAQEVLAAIHIEAFDNTYTPIIDSNYIEMTSPLSSGIRKSFGTRPTIANNTIILRHVGARGMYLDISDSAYVYNNLVIAVNGWRGIQNTNVQYLKLYNNYITGNLDSWAIEVVWDNTAKNNVVAKVLRGIIAYPQNLVFQYNNVWNNEVNYSGFTPDSTNLSVDPMIVNDDTTQGELDFHLQMFSPLIDAGDPDILDKDGSRSDIGLYGGPYGWTYTYMDLAPRPPHNLTAIIEEGLVKLTWNKNTEADFSHYRIYRDTVSNFIYDTTKIVGTTTDTVFYDDLPITNSPKTFYYKLTALDNQNNQSAPSEEIPVAVTGMTEHPPIGYDDYKLLSNYPNPFNPSTIIPYR